MTDKIEVHPSLLKRKIIHFDMDAFYAAIEVRDDSSLRGKPVIVGGLPQSRSVVCTASYEARKFGIRSAMSCAKAFQLCPQAVFILPNFEKYQLASMQIREIFRKYTPHVEPLSLDEAYLDVTDNGHGLYAAQIAKRIQDEIIKTCCLTGSAGIAPNKLLAKIASDMHKPKGLTVVLPEQVLNFMAPLPLRRLHGIGPATEKRLLAAGLRLCRDVWSYSMKELESRFGNMAKWLYESSRGIDERPVQMTRIRKSLGQEETFAADLLSVDELKKKLAEISEEIAGNLKKRALLGRTVTLKVKYADFMQITRRKTIAGKTNDAHQILQIVEELLMLTEAGQRKIRLLGISISNFEDASDCMEEPDLFK